jgi:hypothetical protein
MLVKNSPQARAISENHTELSAASNAFFSKSTQSIATNNHNFTFSSPVKNIGGGLMSSLNSAIKTNPRVSSSRGNLTTQIQSKYGPFVRHGKSQSVEESTLAEVMVGINGNWLHKAPFSPESFPKNQQANYRMVEAYLDKNPITKNNKYYVIQNNEYGTISDSFGSDVKMKTIKNDFDTGREKLRLTMPGGLLGGIGFGKKHKKDKHSNALFCEANLQYLTWEEGRLPTLYFSDGTEARRITQQHAGGSRVQPEIQYKKDYFFAEKQDLYRFQDRCQGKIKDGNPEPDLSMYKGTTTPTDGYYHYERGREKDGRKYDHISSGIVSLNVEGYTDEVIDNIRENVSSDTKKGKKRK